MVTFFDEINKGYADWIEKQKVYYVASAPLDPKGHVNVSPKGYDSFRILNPNKVAYLELSGSGIETQSHVKENGRLTIMFAAMEGAPRILRLWSFAKVYQVGTPEYEEILQEHFAGSELLGNPGLRSIIVADVYKVGSSCGFGVPFFEYKEPRNTLVTYYGKKTMDQVKESWKKNRSSLDGLPGMNIDDEPSSQKKNSQLKLPKNSISLAAAFGAGVAATMIAVKYFNL
ncbi:hypothetical protein K7432_010047 [Basidiobolus ranarum]|uniref:Pyridoxamine 5'-phosphate oxidase putative domain-containing protein n=1 Tax=Basidiobolus ranarum TaxID=34480 RepID=A0ABR2WP96_9FUNG